MANTANMDSVFDNNTESELDFDTIFGEIEDSIIDTVNGVDNDGNSLLTTPEIMKEMAEAFGEDGQIETPANSDAEGTDKAGLKKDEVTKDSEFNKADDITTPANSDAEGTDKAGLKKDEVTKDSEFNKAGDIATPANSDAEGTDKTDINGKALIDKEEKANESVDPDNALLDESYLDPDEYLLEEDEVKDDSAEGKEAQDNAPTSNDDPVVDESADPDDYLLEKDEAEDSDAKGKEAEDDDSTVDESADPDDYLLEEEAPDISATNKINEGECNCGKPECKICNPVPAGSEGTEKTDMNGKALVDKEEEGEKIDLDDALLDESYLDMDEYLLEESDLEDDAGEDDEDYASEELATDDDMEEGCCKKEDVDMGAAPLFGIEPKNEAEDVDFAEDELIDTVDDNDSGSSLNLDYNAAEDEAILDELL